MSAMPTYADFLVRAQQPCQLSRMDEPGTQPELGATLDIAASAFTVNTAAACSGGGISFNQEGATIATSTITGNSTGASGGNVHKGSSAVLLSLRITVIADGFAPLNEDLHGAATGLASLGDNLVRTRGDIKCDIGSGKASAGASPAPTIGANGAAAQRQR